MEQNDEAELKKMYEQDVKDIEAEMQTLINRRNELFKLRAPIDEELVSNFDLLKKLTAKRDSIIYEPVLRGEMPNDKLLQELLFESGSGGSQTKLKAVRKFLKQWTLDVNGYRLATEQIAVQITMKHNGSNIERTEKGILTLLPHLKPVEPVEENWVRFSIFERSLSLHHSYSLDVSKDGQHARIMSDSRCVYGATTLRKALERCVSDFWYD
jgi:hypothetical protein